MKYKNQFKFLSYFIGICMLLAVSQPSAALIQEVYQLQRSLNAIKKFISQLVGPKRKITTYKMLYDALHEAYVKKNLALLDQFEKNIALTIAQQLFQAFVKEGRVTENEPLQYIPFMAYIAQQITERYPDRNTNLYCVCITPGDLTHEFLLIRALRYAGYKTIHVISINSLYDEAIKQALQKNFKTWCQRRNINDVNVDLYQIGYEYMQTQQQKNLTKNHLFLMTKSSYSMIARDEQNATKAITNINNTREIIPNYLNFKVKALQNRITQIYLPYKRSDFWIDSKIWDSKTGSRKLEDAAIKDMQKFIQAWPDVPLYQKNLVIDLINKFFISSQANSFDIGYHEGLFYFDLIKYTALNPVNPCAFRIDLGQVNQVIGNMTASLQEILGRSQVQNFREI